MHYEDEDDDDTLPVGPPATKPKGRGCPRKAQGVSEMEGTVVPKRKQTKCAVSKRDEDSSDAAKSCESLNLSAAYSVLYSDTSSLSS